MSRRPWRAPGGLRVLAFVACTTPGLAAHAGDTTLAFDVAVDGIAIGTHTYELRADGSGRFVDSTMRFRLRVLAFDAYRFDHDTKEHWDGDCLRTIESRTDERGAISTVTGRRTADGFAVSGSAGSATLPACVLSFAYWNPDVLRQTHLLNAQTGAWTPVRVTALGTGSLSVRGQARAATRYRLDTERNRIELWYATEGGEWLGMRSTTRDGHVMTYRLR